jgi:anti-sigma factor RsiW
MSEEQRLREIFAALEDVPERGALCPPAERIVDSADGRLDAEDNRDVIRHIGECAACSAAWWMAREMAGEPEARRSRTLAFPGWPALAAAAVLVVAVAVVGQHWLRPRQPAEAVYRAQEESWLASRVPAGMPLPRNACTLQWTAGPTGTTYDITVASEDLDVLASASALTEPLYSIAPEALATLPADATILWRVTAHLPDGGRLSSKTFMTDIE